MATIYKLTTLRDVYEQVPADKLALCMREIAEGIGVSNQATSMTLGRLEDRGYVRSVPGTTPRRWQVTRKGEQWL